MTRGSRGRIRRVFAALAFAGVSVAACDDSSGPQQLETLTITPVSATLPTGGTQLFTVTGTDTEGNAVRIDGESWSVVNGGGAIGATSGLFTAGTVAGTFTNTVRVTCNGVTAEATVIVSPGALATIVVTPNPGTMPINGTQQYTAVGRDANGNIVAITPVWSVTAGGGAINASTGLFTAGPTAGTFTNTVRATSGTIFGTATAIVTAGALATITVTPDPATLEQGATQQFTAVGRDAGGNVIPITPVWSVNTPPGGGTINSSSGLFTAGNVSQTFTNAVRATSGSIFDDATVIVMAAPTPPVPGFTLGAAAPFGILAGSTVTCAGAPGTVNAWVGVSPGTAMTGFPPCVITGEIHLGDAVAGTAQNDLTTAYNTLAGLPCDVTVGTVNIGSTTRQPGVYCSATSMLVTGDITLDALGDANATFVFQAGSTLTTAGSVILINGAQAQNVYWQVGASATLGGGPATWRGNILADQSITLNNNVTLIGRALTRIGAVTLGTSNTITLP
ncbi:MAG TPA: ice-binding family protein [Gemmatimonadaceae bacterium]|nr:ice-binding family protein [Gemmatimonadaceae bacterium]